jgi:hypothetical protein
MAMVSLRAHARTLVLALVLVAPVVPASAQNPVPAEAIVGPELPVSYPAVLPAGAGGQAVAYGGDVFVVAWTSGREVKVTRVDRNGAVLDRYGIRLSDGSAGYPSVAFDGTNFLVVWGGNGSPVQGRRVSPAGAVLDPAPIELSPATDAYPEVAFGGGSHLVVWTAVAAGTDTRDIFGTRVRPDGVVLDPADEPIVPADGNQFGVDIAFDGTNHLLVWDQYGPDDTLDVQGTLVTADGVALGPGRPISTAGGSQQSPVVTATGSGFLVAWADVGEATRAVYGARVRADGSVVDEAGILIDASADRDFVGQPDASFDGDDVLVTWDAEAGAVRGARVSPAGTVREPGGVELTTGGSPAAAFDGAHHLLTSTSGALEATRVTRSLAPLDPDGVVLTVRANRQTEADVAFDGVNHLVVWTDERVNQGAVFGARVGPDGQVLDGTGFAISEPTARLARRASVAFDGTNFLVVWQNFTDTRTAVSAARISRSGEVLDRFVIDGPSFVEAPAVAFGNGVFLVVWSRFEVLTAARVSPDGTVLDPGGIPLASLPGVPEVDVAAGASEFLVVWQNGLLVDPTGDFDVYGTVVSPDGTVVTPRAIPISTGPLHQENPQVAWHDGIYLVVWGESPDHGFPPPGLSDIRGARVDPAGTVLDPAGIPISTAPESQQWPDVAAADGRFLVAWTDRRRRAVAGKPLADVYGTAVDPAGTVGSEFLIGVTDALEYEGAAAALAARPAFHDVAVVSGRYLPDGPYGTTRTLLRRVFPK